MASPQQIKLIHTLKNSLKLEEEEYRSMLSGYGVESSKEMDQPLAKEFLDQLRDMAVSAGVWKKPSHNRKTQKKFDDLKGRDSHMATPKQLRMIEAMWKGVSRADNDEDRAKALRNFLKRFQCSDIRFLEKAKASKVIAALENMAFSRDKKKQTKGASK